MCDIIEYGRGSPKHIKIFFERDFSLRETEVLLITGYNTDKERAVKIRVSDRGDIIVGVPVKCIEGVDII